MARGDGTAWVKLQVSLPAPLIWAIESIQKRYAFDSRNAAIKFLVENSPIMQQTIADAMQTRYDAESRETTPAGS